MFTPNSLTIALLMMITSAVCWGSWANTFKGVKNYRFELFYWDYAIGIFLISLILALTMGSTGHDANSFLNNVHSADTSNIVSTMVGGAIFNLANLLLVAAIDMAGLAIAFPVSIGIALVVGVVLSYRSAAQRKCRPARRRRCLRGDRRDHWTAKPTAVSPAPAARLSKKSIVTCIVSGVLMGLWAPFVARGMTHGNTLGPYSIAVFLTLGALLSCSIWNVYFMKKPLVGEPVSFSGYFSGPAIRPHARTARRNHLGHRHGLQSGCRKFHRRSDLVCDRPVSPNGSSAVGSACLEGIRRRRKPRQDVPGPDVRLLRPGDPAGSQSQRIRLFCFSPRSRRPFSAISAF